jgi:hypothetical protein
MEAKTILIFFILISTISTYGQNKPFSIYGKWQKVAESGSDGANKFTIGIKNGEILLFKKNKKVEDNAGNIGRYKLKGRKLKVTLNNSLKYYLVFYNDDDLNKMFLSPVTPEYQIICDEGCSFTYVRQNH